MVPRFFYGGKAGVDMQTAIQVIFSAAADGQFIGTFDYEVAFDMMDPAIALPIMEARGMPHCVAGMLAAVWFHQRRFLQVAGCTSPEPEDVDASLPQGDAWSMIALCAVIACPAEEINEDYEESMSAMWTTERGRQPQQNYAGKLVKHGRNGVL